MSTAFTTPAAPSPAAPKARRGLKFIGLVLLLVLSAGIVHAWWASRAAVALRATVAGYARRGEPTEPAQLEQAPVPDAENAALDLMAAANAAPVGSTPFGPATNVGLALPWTPKERAAVDAVMPALGPMLDGVAAAATKSRSDWRIRVKSPTIGVLLPSLNPVRHLANLLAVAALDAHVHGDDALALERVRHILAVSRTTEQMAPTLVRHLVAIGVRALACGVIEQLAPDLRTDDPTVRAKALLVIRDLLDGEATLREGQLSALYGERIFVLDTAQCLVSGRLTLPQLTGMAGGRGLGLGTFSGVVTAAPGGRYFGKPFLLSDARHVMERTTEILSVAQTAADWPTASAALAPIDKAWTAKSQDGTLHDLARIMAPSLDRAMMTQFRAFTEGRLAATALALRCHATDHTGAPPATLAALSPTYLPAVPLDPFAPGNPPLRYAPNPADPIVYSVDENAVDDGGSEKPKRASSALPRESRWQALDAVMHLTRQPRDPQSVSEEFREEDPNKPKSTDPTQNQ